MLNAKRHPGHRLLIKVPVVVVEQTNADPMQGEPELHLPQSKPTPLSPVAMANAD